MYKVVSAYKPATQPGMPGPYPGQVIRVHAENSIDTASAQVNREVVKRMIASGMQALTGDARSEDAWARFISPKDVVGIKVNCSGAPQIRSSPEVVAAIAENLVAVGVPAKQIYLYERFQNQLDSVGYPKYLPAGVNLFAAETSRSSILNYDPKTYVECNFFGEEDTRSNLVRLVADTLTKIINVPNAKEHQAAGVTGCLKNVAYGNFSNVARSHQYEKTNTYSFIGTLASVEPVRSRVVLHIMDGLRGVWHAGPFSEMARFRFFPKQLMIGTDPVAMDHMLIDVIEAKRKAEGAVSIFDRAASHVGKDNSNPNTNHFIREPGHVEYAGKLGLGVYDSARIKLRTDDRIVMLLLAAALPLLFWDAGPSAAGALHDAHIERIAVPAAQAEAWKGVAGMSVQRASSDLEGAIKLLVPSANNRVQEASASTAPWVVSNGWRFVRDPKGRFYYEVTGKQSAVAAAEAFAYNSEALIHTDAAGLKPLAEMLRFLGTIPGEQPLPPVADIGYIDDGSPASGEVMNLLVRDNLLFKLVPAPDPKLKTNVKLGTPDYPLAEPPRTRQPWWRTWCASTLTDEKRSLRIYGSPVVVGRLTGSGGHLRLHLLNYAGANRKVDGIRVRVLGQYSQHKLWLADGAGVELQDFTADGEATEFTLPELKTYAVVDLSR